MATNYEVDYNDSRFAKVEADRQADLKESDAAYDSIISGTDKFYQDQIDASKDWADTQSQLQQDRTDFTIETVEQQKEQAHKDYIKEQSGAYADWQKESNRYGANAEHMAAMGMSKTGYSESSQVRMYNAYQNRVATARESYKRAVLNYDNAIKDAQLQNNSILAEIAYNALQVQLELSLQGFQYKNQLLLDKAAMRREINNAAYSRRQDVVDQINTENQLSLALAQQKLQQDKFDWEKEQVSTNSVIVKEQASTNPVITKDDEATPTIEKNSASDNPTVSTKPAPKVNNVVANPVANGTTGNGEWVKATSDKIISTKYYNGPIAEDVGGFGYMGKDKNGVAYQPKGVYINGKAYELTKTGKTAKQVMGPGAINSSGVKIENQNVWQANGQLFIWNGTKNRYERIR